MARICIDCKADVIVVESEALLKKVLLVQHKLPELKCIVQWRGERPLSDQRRLAKSHKKHILSWEGLLELGRALQADRLEERLTKVAINQCCSLVYATSNKGVMLSHDNLTWSAKMALGVIRAPGFNPTPSPGDEVMISFLPLAHISTQLIDIYYLISIAGTSVFLPTDILHNQEDFFAALEEVSVCCAPMGVITLIVHCFLTCFLLITPSFSGPAFCAVRTARDIRADLPQAGHNAEVRVWPPEVLHRLVEPPGEGEARRLCHSGRGAPSRRPKRDR